ncbi:aldehyde dehydrogenase (NAD+) [Sphingobium wenxiniae]|uniref:Aldehyde dehydrogenase (NAD+) n=1 Tax=Sphingobium wenxiniae (strain DSM 21828 / CGMCC 1.7748 / JZ-1) TaxID=595605 RepID=A0A562KE88_SPHWJ|nr:aldehyde dehydrogenase family protein [Sphingobium wenxiniae]MBB6191012.1 aldehyde dehydrogenase (NAD+) [Sphingobium wenxiniae]TWH93682.1 aldehyde dehydrogenase (NAD+) [Sphingobium wenxiniae]
MLLDHAPGTDTRQAWPGLYDGEYRQGTGASFEVENPSTGKCFATVDGASAEQISTVIGKARTAFDGGGWSSLPVQQRAEKLRAMLGWIQANADRFTDLVVAEAGLVRASMVKFAQIDLAIKHGLDIIDMALTLPSVTDNPLPLSERFTPHYSLQSFQVYEPVGVVSAISAYNFPLWIAAWKIFPALITGNTVILRPSPLTPLSALLLGEAAQVAGLPDGVFSIVAEGGNEGGVILSTDPRVDMVTFTGSSNVGRMVMKQAADTMKRLQLELGGKSAQIYLPDALDMAPGAADRVCLAHSGQGCVLGTRIFVPESEKARILANMAKSLSRAVIGPADAPATTMGPVISRAQVERCESFVSAAVAAGGRIVHGGKRPVHLPDGHYFEPTILDLPDNGNPAAQEEIFGPVVCVIGYRDIDHAIEMANESPYGLSGHVFGKDMTQAMAVAARLRTGTVNVNGGMFSAYASSGGRGLSGVGRERGVEGLRIYQEIKCMSVTT